MRGEATTGVRGSPAPRRRLDRAKREAEILDAAFYEFAAKGYAATRLEDVARRAGVAKGLPHFYFERKEDLFRAVLRRLIVPTWIDLVEASLTAEGSTRDLMRATLAMVYERLAANKKAREMMRLLIAEGPRFPELTELYHSEVGERAVSIWRRLVTRGISRGEFRAGPILNNPHVIYGPVLMAAIWQMLFGRRHGLDLDSWFESHLDLVLNGLERPKRGGRG
ncbi:MAG: TetR/AcrR family transcriptional regulator [Methylobacteriaceae bacterium]|nr:TetR/AcrR family transcriptional regulator [Methylobacteriaceae bacterium]